MTYDLHAYVLPNFRKQGHLSLALPQSIIPHLLRNRSEQRITIDKSRLGEKGYNASQSVALRAGFYKVAEAEGNITYVITEESADISFINGEDKQIPKKRIEELQKQINFLSRSALVLRSELEIHTGVNEYTEELKGLSDEITRHIIKVENFWIKHQRESQ
ncbi:hypothetical protein [Flavipsychrobacter stenotrophus]|nr:hypothetical protein [Flavipsychrobacter stenotrophus]